MTDDEIRAELAAARAAGRPWRVALAERALGLGGSHPAVPDWIDADRARRALAIDAANEPTNGMVAGHVFGGSLELIAAPSAVGDPDWQAKVWDRIDGDDSV